VEGSALKVLRNKWIFVRRSTSSGKNEKTNFCIKFDISTGRSCESEMRLSSSWFHFALNAYKRVKNLAACWQLSVYILHILRAKPGKCDF
jgi:hypothetical protein